MSSLSPVQLTSTKELRMWLLEASPVNRFQWREGAKERMMGEIAGPSASRLFAGLSQDSFFGENVPGLLNSGYFPEILRSLAQAGYVTRWIVLGVDDVGGNHRRKRLWLLAYADTGQCIEPQEQIQAGRAAPDNSGEYVAHSVSDSEGSAHGSKVWRGFERWEDEDIKEWYEVGGNPTNFSGQWAIEPNVGRVAHGVASRVDRLKALGNGQVPLVADVAWGMLGGQELEEV